jgi:hypothetical protein
MQYILYEEPSAWLFIFVTCVLGGAAAWMTGRAFAFEWRSPAALAVALLFLGLVTRFIHHALFSGTMFTLQYYVVDTAILMIFGFVSFRFHRTQQMITQYYWLYERNGPLAWRERTGEPTRKEVTNAQKPA